MDFFQATCRFEGPNNATRFIEKKILLEGLDHGLDLLRLLIGDIAGPEMAAKSGKIFGQLDAAGDADTGSKKQ